MIRCNLRALGVLVSPPRLRFSPTGTTPSISARTVSRSAFPVRARHVRASLAQPERGPQCRQRAPGREARHAARRRRRGERCVRRPSPLAGGPTGSGAGPAQAHGLHLREETRPFCRGEAIVARPVRRAGTIGASTGVGACFSAARAEAKSVASVAGACGGEADERLPWEGHRWWGWWGRWWV